MKPTGPLLLVLSGLLFIAPEAAAQSYGGTNRYADPRSRYGLRPAPTTPGQPVPPLRPTLTPQPALPPQVTPGDAVRFSSLPTNAAFFFLSDTSRSFLWLKISPTSASNTVNQKVATIPAAVLVKTQATAVERPPRTAPRSAPAAESPASATLVPEPPARLPR